MLANHPDLQRDTCFEVGIPGARSYKAVMSEFNPHDDLPEEFRDVADRLRESRPTLSPLESDQLKLRAMQQAEVGDKARRRPMVSRWVTLGLTTAILGGTAATGLANCGNFFGHGQNAASSQYQPGHPCDPRYP